ncbi:MAG: DUF4906 domain-containing protein [Bacteroidales bacterium]|nr:DUF4906 domain-containing protein [Bacteroidales bacterium]
MVSNKLILFFCASFLLLSCTAESLWQGRELDNAVCRVEFRIRGSEQQALQTRSSVTSSENALGTIDIYVYDAVSGRKVAAFSADAGRASSCSVPAELAPGRMYEALVVANESEHNAPDMLDEAISSMKCGNTGIAGWNSEGLPMSGRVRFIPGSASSVVDVALTRLLARLDLSVDTSGMQHGTIFFTSATVRQMNTVCPFFGEGRASDGTDVCDGDLSKVSDISSLNWGRPISFYVMENKQGSILRGNTDPERKVPDEVEAAGGNPDLCTYIELRGIYTDLSGYLKGEPVTARLYLGEDACSNFDVSRNCSYTVRLSITDNGCLRTDWKIDCNLEDSRTLAFDGESRTVEPGESVGVFLETNLCYEDRDFGYTLSGDLSCFDVSYEMDESVFHIRSSATAPDGVYLEILASTWDGVIRTLHRTQVVRNYSQDYDFVWRSGSGLLYVAQQGALLIADKSSGAYPTGAVSVRSTQGCCTVWRSGSVWYADAVKAGEDLLEVSVNGVPAGSVPLMILAPELRFPSEDIFLPLDGASVDCGPYYYRKDGSRLYYDDFVSELYYDLLDVTVSRELDNGMLGSFWSRAYPVANPVVVQEPLSDDFNAYSFCLGALSYGRRNIAENYDFSSGPVYLERLVAVPCDTGTGVSGTSARLYTEDPFGSSCNLGAKSSWALARWYDETEHDEVFDFAVPNLVHPGNDSSYAGARYAFNEENKYSFSFPDRNSFRVTVLYGDNCESAMPERYFYMIPTMINRNSSEVYESPFRYEAQFTVNLAVGGVAEDNGAGGCDISLEWSFPRRDEGLLSYLENKSVGSNCDGSAYAEGMYRRLYVIYGYSADVLRSSVSPDFAFRNMEMEPGPSSLLPGFSLRVPEGYASGYDLVLWKYGDLYPWSNGWLEK